LVPPGKPAGGAKGGYTIKANWRTEQNRRVERFASIDAPSKSDTSDPRARRHVALDRALLTAALCAA
jgi:hypothetical protein